MKKLPLDTRNNIIQLLRTGLSARKIALQLGVGRATVDGVQRENMPNVEKPAKGRPRKLSARDRCKLARLVPSGKADTATQLQKELGNTMGVHVSAQTVRNALKEEGLKAVVKKRSRSSCRGMSRFAMSLL